MTHEQIERAIGKLRELMACSNRTTGSEIVGAIVGYLNTDDACDKLIELLEQADPDTHMELPVDADGEVIHIGDTVYKCAEEYRVKWLDYRESGLVIVWCNRDCHDFAMTPGHLTHHPPVTVESLLLEFWKICKDGYDIGNNIPEYAEKLREVMADE